MSTSSVSVVSAMTQIVWAARLDRPVISEVAAPHARGRRADGLALDRGETVEAKAATWWKAALAEALRQWSGLIKEGRRLIVVAAVKRGAAFERPEITSGVDLYVFTPDVIDVRGALEDLRKVLQGVGPRDLPRDLLREVFDGEIPTDPEDFSLALWVRELGVLWAHALEDWGFKPTFTVGWGPVRSSRAAPRVRLALTREGFRLHVWWGRKPGEWVRVALTREGLRPSRKSRGGYVLEVRREDLDRFLSLLASEVEALIKVWEGQEY